MQRKVVDAKLKCAEAYRTAISLLRAVIMLTKQVWHYNKFWHAQMEERQVHIPNEFDDVPSPVFPSILDIEKAWDVNLSQSGAIHFLLFHISICHFENLNY